MSKPIRIQRKRAKGFKLPTNTICVDRSTKFGNPFIIGIDGTQAECYKYHRYLLAGYINLTAKVSIKEQKKYLKYIGENIYNIRGKNLACWCAKEPCHATTLLEIANKATGRRK